MSSLCQSLFNIVYSVVIYEGIHFQRLICAIKRIYFWFIVFFLFNKKFNLICVMYV